MRSRPRISGRSRLFLYLLPFLLLPLVASAQSKKELEDKRKKIIRDIAATEKMISKTKANKEATYDRFVALQNQISSRESLILTIEQELLAAEDGISRNQMVIESLQADVTKMRDEYARTVRYAFRQKTLTNPLLFILSASSLNQAFRRWLFLRKYDERRREQARLIRETQEMLRNKTEKLQATRIEKEQLLIAMQGQKASLGEELTEKNNMLRLLSKDEVRLRADLNQKQAARDQLDRAIESVISAEVEKRIDEAKSKPAPKKEESAPPAPAPAPAKKDVKAEKPEVVAQPETAPESAVSASSFGKMQGKLPWPVENGFISKAFGRQKHPTLRNLEITNNGIDIRTDDNEQVRAIYEGVVAGIQYIPGHENTVIIQHGDYYTVYSNLSSTSLKKGDTVKGRQAIGTVSTNAITGTTELHFELWRQKERLNPGVWIKK
ncbi:MAG: murein hydrolase activator EnvC family protein [Bacteroidota bacterium]